jgi:ribosomal protein S18 acetylase RimI-like enzyme
MMTPTFEMVSGSLADLDSYLSLVCHGMSADDVHSVEEYAAMTRAGRLQSWWLDINGTKAGWCALYPWHGKYADRAWHLYGVWVASEYRRRGLAEAMWRFRMSLVPAGVPITVSVQPGKEGSERLLEKFGFQRVGFNSPWNEYVLQS